MRRCAFLTLDDPTGWTMDDDLAIEPYLQCTTMIMRCREHLGECLTKWLES